MANVDAMQRRNEWEIAGSIGVHVSIPTFVGVHVSSTFPFRSQLRFPRLVGTFLHPHVRGCPRFPPRGCPRFFVGVHVFFVGVHVFFYSTFLRGTDQKECRLLNWSPFPG